MSNFIRNPWCKIPGAVRGYRDEFYGLTAMRMKTPPSQRAKRTLTKCAAIEQTWRGYMSEPNAEEILEAVDMAFCWAYWEKRK